MLVAGRFCDIVRIVRLKLSKWTAAGASVGNRLNASSSAEHRRLPSLQPLRRSLAASFQNPRRTPIRPPPGTPEWSPHLHDLTKSSQSLVRENWLLECRKSRETGAGSLHLLIPPLHGAF